MKTIIIKTQKEMDNLPDSFEKFTTIEIRSSETISVRNVRENSHVLARENSRVEACENSRVLARENSYVIAWDSSHVEARQDSQVEAWENSYVIAWDSSRVEAWGNSRVLARENSYVIAWDSSHVEAWDSSRVEARQDSRVEAWENSYVLARENSHVKAWMCAVVHIESKSVKVSCGDNTTMYKHASSEVRSVSTTANIIDEIINPTFETWLERGYVVADGLHLKLIKEKEVKGCKTYQCEDFSKETIFVVKNGENFSHGTTLKEAFQDLEFKIKEKNK